MKKALLLSSALAATFLGARIFISGRLEYLFLAWNLALAWAPFAISTVLTRRYDRLRPTTGPILLMGAWLLFFPNAPYVLTDLLHLRERPPIPEWYDLLMILSFAWTALMLGFASLADIQALIARTWTRTAGWIAAGSALLLASFGIYLGRFLRWNSWDILARPSGLLRDVGHRLLYPEFHPRTFTMTLTFAAFLIVAYFTVQRNAARPSARLK